MMKRLFALFAAVAAMNGPVFADVVYDNGAYGSSANTFTIQMVADDFRLAGDAVLTGASLYAFADNGLATPWDGTLDYAIFADDGGRPGLLLAAGQGRSITRSVVANWGYPYGEQFRFDLSFEAPFTGTAGTAYWFAAHIGSTYQCCSNPSWYWNFTSAEQGGNSMGSLGGTGNNWADYWGRDRAFYLIGSPVPEPATAWMAATGTLLLLAVAKRGRRQRYRPQCS